MTPKNTTGKSDLQSKEWRGREMNRKEQSRRDLGSELTAT